MAVKQTICKNRQTNRDRQRLIRYTYSYHTQLDTYSLKDDHTKDTLNQPVTSRAAQILVSCSKTSLFKIPILSVVVQEYVCNRNHTITDRLTDRLTDTVSIVNSRLTLRSFVDQWVDHSWLTFNWILFPLCVSLSVSFLCSLVPRSYTSPRETRHMAGPCDAKSRQITGPCNGMPGHKCMNPSQPLATEWTVDVGRKGIP